MDIKTACSTLKNQPRAENPRAHAEALQSLTAPGFTRATFAMPNRPRQAWDRS